MGDGVGAALYVEGSKHAPLQVDGMLGQRMTEEPYLHIPSHLVENNLDIN